MRVPLFVVLFSARLFSIQAIGQVVVPQPAEGVVISELCDGCFKPDQSQNCKDATSLGIDPNHNCYDNVYPVEIGGVFKCLGYGERVWKDDLWLRRVKIAALGESGNKCETWKWKACAKDRKCKYLKVQIGNQNGVPVYSHRCENDAAFVDAKFEIDKYPTGDGCYKPDPNNPKPGDPIFVPN